MEVAAHAVKHAQRAMGEGPAHRSADRRQVELRYYVYHGHAGERRDDRIEASRERRMRHRLEQTDRRAVWTDRTVGGQFVDCRVCRRVR